MARLELSMADQAVADFAKALALDPSNAGTHNNYGTALARDGRSDEALAAYTRAIELAPAFAQAHYNRGNVLSDLGRHADAIVDFDTALALRADYAEAAHNRGICERALQRVEQALASFDLAITLRPGYPEALNSKAVLLHEEKRHREAAKLFAELLQVAPKFPYALGARIDARLHDCDWSEFDAELAALRSGVRERRPVASPFVLLSTHDDPELQLQCARLFVANEIRPAVGKLSRGAPYRHDRIRVAYVSGDFGDHPVGHLMAEAFERHRRDRFEIIAISLNERTDDALRPRLERGFDEFVEMAGHTDIEIARCIREREVDIAVDLMGHTLGNRMGVFAHRPAPVQVNYLGYPATSGADWIDYIIADPVTIPAGDSKHYSERIVRLHGNFFANSRRTIAPSTPSRTEEGLPEDAFVFCCLASHRKILPATFSLWMRLLQQVPHSVLWLAATGAEAQQNLCREAERAGIDPERLLFARRAALMEDHLVRYRCADVFVDTFPYNSHTTASDALLAGLPVMTCVGHSFASRIASSLLNAAGLPELVTRSLAEYEALAVRLATEPERLASIRERLASSHATQPLFDCERFTRSLEEAYIHMWERCERGERPADFDVQAPAHGASYSSLAIP